MSFRFFYYYHISTFVRRIRNPQNEKKMKITKTIALLLILTFNVCNAFSQLITDDEFDKAEEKYLPDVKLKDRSKWLFDQGWFTKDGLPMYNIVIPVDTNLTTDQVYVSAYQTIISSFHDVNNVTKLTDSYNTKPETKLNDREAGAFVVEGSYKVTSAMEFGGLCLIRLQIRFDIKKGKVRCICIPQYIQRLKSGWVGFQMKPEPIFEKPYTEGYKKAVGSTRFRAKVYLRTYIWTKIIMDRLEKHITDGASGIENDNW